MTLAIEARGLRRAFGDVVAVDDVDLEVPEGEVLGLVGPDAAGKTTLIRLLTGVLERDAGTVALFGHDLDAERDPTRLLLGYMSQAFGLYEDLTVIENIRFFAAIRRVTARDRRVREQRLLGFTRLEAFTRRKAGDLSGGMKQKLGLICTLVHEPRVLFLDEPTNGVDPVSRREFWDILGELRGRVTVVVATPYMDEAERCDRVALMAGGRILALDAPDALRAEVHDPVWEVETDRPFLAAEVLGLALPGAEITLFGDLLHVVGPLEERVVSDVLAAAGQSARTARIPPTMEDAYVRLAQPATARPGEDP
ncbi:MAG: ABC transporter ATP-binding protein [Deltaproteobacteria bacterium]|nr:ABC transporter ATP-binding protein [Deltaproteobacteria bacterium]